MEWSDAAFETDFRNPTLESVMLCFNLARSLVMSNGGLDQQLQCLSATQISSNVCENAFY